MNRTKINIFVFLTYVSILFIYSLIISINYHTEFSVVLVMEFFGGPILFTIIPIEFLDHGGWMLLSKVLLFLHFILLFVTVAGFFLAFIKKYFKVFFITWNSSILLLICHNITLSLLGNYIGP